ncbi:MAG: DM13 domain-containing protein [Litorimonas sp.]
MIKYSVIVFSLAMLASSAFAGDGTDKPFVKKRYSIHGTAKVEAVDGQKQLVFSEDFKTKNGPDLKVYLSKRPLDSLSARDVDDSAIRLSVLKSHKGTQTYVIPENINLDDYESVVIQCEAYSVLWGGFEL